MLRGIYFTLTCLLVQTKLLSGANSYLHLNQKQKKKHCSVNFCNIFDSNTIWQISEAEWVHLVVDRDCNRDWELLKTLLKRSSSDVRRAADWFLVSVRTKESQCWRMNFWANYKAMHNSDVLLATLASFSHLGEDCVTEHQRDIFGVFRRTGKPQTKWNKE